MILPDGGRQRGHLVTEREHKNPIDLETVTDEERARMLLDYLDTFRAEFGVTPRLMPLDDEGKGPIATGRFRVVEESPTGEKIPTVAAMAATVDGFEAARRIAEEGARGFCLYAGVPEFGTGEAVFTDHDDTEHYPTPTDEPTLEVLSGSGRGEHETYRNDPDDPVQNAVVGEKYGEIRARNLYVILPGSVHPSGGVYHVVEDRPIATLADANLTDEMRPGGGPEVSVKDRKRTATVGTDSTLVEYEQPEIVTAGETEDGGGNSDAGDDRVSAETVRDRRERAAELLETEGREKRLKYALDTDDVLRGLFYAKVPEYDFDDRSVSEWRLVRRLAFWLAGDVNAVAWAMDQIDAEKWHVRRPGGSYRRSRLKAVGTKTEFYTPNTEALDAIPFAAMHFELDELRRFARKRGLEWPTTERVHERIGEATRDALAAEGYTVLDAPTSAGKTHTVVTTEWFDRAVVPEAVTGDRPVAVFTETCEARDQAVAMAQDADIDVKVLLGYQEACGTASGDHAYDELYIDGEPAAKWIANAVENRGLAISVVHTKAARLAEQGHVATDRTASAAGTSDVGELPCCEGDTKCRTETQWPEGGFMREDGDGPKFDLVLATHPFAFVPSLRSNTNVVLDEQPSYNHDLANDQERLRRAVTALLREVDSPREVNTFEDLVTAGKTGLWDDGVPLGKPAAQIRKELMHAIDTLPPMDWFFEDSDAHTLAPALAKAIWYAAGDNPDANGRRTATVPYHPPRLDATASDEEGWNRTWVTVVLDDENRVRTIRNAPDFSQARSVVGLDAWPTPWLWQRNVHPNMTVERVLDADERRLWRRLERGLTVVQVGDATRPAGNDGCYFTEEHAKAVIQQLRAEFGPAFSKAGCASTVEDRVVTLLSEAGVDPDRLGTMHYGEEKSRNDFASEVVGLVYGCIDPGDDYVLDLLAECDLTAQPVMVEGDDGERHREHRRTFEGADADHAKELLGSVRETHTAQMTGRFGRNQPDGQQSVVFVATDATPPGFADYHVPGVLWLARPSQKQRDLVEHLRENTGTTAKAAAEAVGCSKEHARQAFRALVEQGKVTVAKRSGEHGADVFDWTGGLGPSSGRGPAFADVSLTPKEITNSRVWGAYTYELAVSPPDAVSRPVDESDSLVPSVQGSSQTGLSAFTGPIPPPDEAN